MNIYTTDGPSGDARPVESARLVQVIVAGNALENAGKALQAAAEGADAIIGVRVEPYVLAASTSDQSSYARPSLSIVVYGTADHVRHGGHSRSRPVQ